MLWKCLQLSWNFRSQYQTLPTTRTFQHNQRHFNNIVFLKVWIQAVECIATLLKLQAILGVSENHSRNFFNVTLLDLLLLFKREKNWNALV